MDVTSWKLLFFLRLIGYKKYILYHHPSIAQAHHQVIVYIPSMGQNYQDFLASITSVDGYPNLHRCAASAYANALSYSGFLYPNCQSRAPPADYANCLCTNDGSELSKAVTNAVPNYGCSSGSSSEASSALSVFNDYCSTAARAVVTVSRDSGGDGKHRSRIYRVC